MSTISTSNPTTGFVRLSHANPKNDNQGTERLNFSMETFEAVTEGLSTGLEP